MTLRRFAASLAIAGLAFAGCDKKEEGANSSGDKPAAQTSKAAPAAPSFDVAAAKKELVGNWTVKSGKKVLYTFEITDTTAKVTDKRFKGDKVYEGKLEVTPTAIKVSDTKGAAYSYGWAKTSKGLHMGVGAVSKIDKLDAFEAKLGMFNTLKRTADGCVITKKMGSKETETKVSCSSEEKDGATIFSYEVPDPFKKGSMKTEKRHFVDGYLMSADLAKGIATK